MGGTRCEEIISGGVKRKLGGYTLCGVICRLGRCVWKKTASCLTFIIDNLMVCFPLMMVLIVPRVRGNYISGQVLELL